MDDEILRKIQLTELEIAKEIKRVCEAENIPYFLIGGTLLGAVRHGGFIPWDDDMDIGMLREDYARFCEAAPKALSEDFCLQTWHTEGAYPLSFGKVRKKGTLFLETKSSGKRLKENGFFVDVFPYDYAPDLEKERAVFRKKQKTLSRILLAKNCFTPWLDGKKFNLKKRVGYLLYQFLGLFSSASALVNRYETLVASAPVSETVYEQAGSMRTMYFSTEWFRKTETALFEGVEFSIPSHKEEYLTISYGDYMQLPPIEERENQHAPLQIDFGEGE